MTLIYSPDYVTVSQVSEEEGEVLGGQEVMYYTQGTQWVPVYASRFPQPDEIYAKPD